MKLNENAWKGFQPPSLHHGGVLSLHVRPSAKQQRFKRRRCASAGSEPFSLLICPDDAKFVLISVLALIEPICPKIYSKSRLKSAKIPLPVTCDAQKRRFLNSLSTTTAEGVKTSPKKNASLQNVSRLFGPAQFVKCRRSFLELNT